LKFRTVALVIFLVLLADQVFKFYIKTNFYQGEEINVIGNWFRLHFIENEGMAFGMKYGGDTGKTILTVFRIIAVAFIAFYLHRLIKRKAHPGLIFSMALIFAGAMGNIIDSVFYGVLFEGSDWHVRNVAAFLPEGGGYAPLLHGQVVDMLFFPIFEGPLPSWIPFIGGNDFLFFRPVFNLADSYISIGVFIILVFQRKFFGKKSEPENGKTEEPQTDLPEDAEGKDI
jgi:signal peptidase II